MELKRRLYTRGSSYETTIPKPLLFSLDLQKKHHVRFVYDSEKGRWYLDFEPVKDKQNEPIGTNANVVTKDDSGLIIGGKKGFGKSDDVDAGDGGGEGGDVAGDVAGDGGAGGGEGTGDGAGGDSDED